MKPLFTSTSIQGQFDIQLRVRLSSQFHKQFYGHHHELYWILNSLLYWRLCNHLNDQFYGDLRNQIKWQLKGSDE